MGEAQPVTARIDRLWPDPEDRLSDDQLVEGLGPGLRVNFVQSIDGAATLDGRSGGLSDAADKRRFELLRRVADVVIVGAGTVRAEGYGSLRVSDASVRWRLAHGMSEHPLFAIVSGSLRMDPAARPFSDALVRPIVITRDGGGTSAAAARARFDEVADVIAEGEEFVELAVALSALHARGLTRLLCEGGPSLFASLLAVDAVDEVCVTIAPTLESGEAPRIAHGPAASPRGMQLVEVLKSGSALLLRYRRS